MANGATREQRLAPEPGAPVIRRWYGVTLDYRHLGPLAEEVEARLAFPGPHDLTLWKHVTLGYLADGAPHRVVSSLAPRPAPPHTSRGRAEPLRPTVRFAGNPLAVPSSLRRLQRRLRPRRSRWFDPESPRFKLSAPPPAGTRLIVQVVPLFAMVTAAEDHARRYRDPIREPRRITLVETELP